MSVLTFQDALRMPWDGSESPREPSAVWTVAMTVAGDASGDFVDMAVVLAPVSDRKSAQMFSLEGWSLQSTRQISEDFEITPFGFSLTPRLISRPNRVSGQLLATAGIGRASTNLREVQRRIWLGVQTAASVQASIEVFMNNINGEFYNAVMWGYIWNPTARLLGGPQYPVRGVMTAGLQG